jgi:hypothetical protein
MTYMFEAIVATDGGDFRLFQVAPDAYCVTEDGVEGLADYVVVEPDDRALLAPENLVGTLTAWVYEMRRGITVLDSALARRRR